MPRPKLFLLTRYDDRIFHPANLNSSYIDSERPFIVVGGKNACLRRALKSRNFRLMLPDEQATSEQIAIFRAMTGEQRLRLAEQLYWSARKMKAAAVRSQHPIWSEEQVQREVARIFLHARS